ncbi:hypothetical protein ASG90_10165 [Nocardioides sp. Soil797]|nr:hypothetical protein ASG90_10165 [Nocardioides sp. Soil797]
MLNPEAMFQKLDSGSPGALRELAVGLYRSAERTDRVADRISHATLVPIWEGLMALTYRTVGQNTYVASAGTAWHVARTADFVVATADTYEQVKKDALRTIGFWRQRQPDLEPASVDLLKLLVCMNLAVIQTGYDAWLVEAGTSLHHDGGKAFEEWLTNGFEKEYAFKGLTGATSGSRIPDSLLTGEDYVPQGLGYDDQHDLTLHSSYKHGEDGNDLSRMTIINNATGREENTVQLGGTKPSADPNAEDIDTEMPPTHSGGTAVLGDRVFVVSTEDIDGDGERVQRSFVYEYSLKDLRQAGKGEEVPALHKTEVPASSYVSTHNGELYLGKYEKSGPGTLYQVNPQTLKEITRFSTPAGVNGVAIQDDRFTYATNDGRYEEGRLVQLPRDATENNPLYGTFGPWQGSLDVGNLPEEVFYNERTGKFVLNFESGADPYSAFGEDTKHDKLGDLWSQTHLMEIPVEALGPAGPGGYTVEPPTLEEAARDFSIASDELDEISVAIKGTSLPASILGDVPSAPGYAGKVDAYLDQAAVHIASGKTSTGTTSQGLLNQMRTYEDVDDAVSAGLTPTERILDFTNKPLAPPTS